MGTMASQITNLTGVYSTVYSGADQRKHQISASLAFVREYIYIYKYMYMYMYMCILYIYMRAYM